MLWRAFDRSFGAQRIRRILDKWLAARKRLRPPGMGNGWVGCDEGIGHAVERVFGKVPLHPTSRSDGTAFIRFDLAYQTRDKSFVPLVLDFRWAMRLESWPPSKALPV